LKPGLTIGIYGIQDIADSNIPTIAHDHALAIIKDGSVIYYVHLERLDRIKNSNSLPKKIYDILKEKKLLGEEFNIVFTDNYTGRAFINSQGNMRFEAAWPEKLSTEPEIGNSWWLDKSRKAYVVNHELAHLGSCLPFYGDFKDESLLIHFDGGASRSNFSAWYFSGDKLKSLEHHWDFRWLSNLFNSNALMFGIIGAKPIELNSVPGKLMGFASFGTYKPEIESWLIANHFFENCWRSKKEFFEKVKTQFGISINQMDTRNRFLQDIVATVQEIFTRNLLEAINRLKDKTCAKNLYFAGGSALNIVSNSRIIETCCFDQVFIPPCCNDSGLALGAAAFYEWWNGQKINIHSPYLNNWGIEEYEISYSDETIKTLSELLIQKKVVGVCIGFGEAGPRALGNRSIIGLASDKMLAQKISQEHKGREWYRPVAPIMLEKNAKYFTGLDQINLLSKYMLLDFNILEERISELQGTVHINGTARIQTIYDRSDNPFIYDLLMNLDQNHQVKSLINTSFNRKGEPMVHTTDDAMKSAKAMSLDAVVLNGELVIL
jgi:carbamoyltransferase